MHVGGVALQGIDFQVSTTSLCITDFDEGIDVQTGAVLLISQTQQVKSPRYCFPFYRKQAATLKRTAFHLQCQGNVKEWQLHCSNKWPWDVRK